MGALALTLLGRNDWGTDQDIAVSKLPGGASGQSSLSPEWRRSGVAAAPHRHQELPVKFQGHAHTHTPPDASEIASLPDRAHTIAVTDPQAGADLVSTTPEGRTKGAHSGGTYVA